MFFLTDSCVAFQKTNMDKLHAHIAVYFIILLDIF